MKGFISKRAYNRNRRRSSKERLVFTVASVASVSVWFGSKELKDRGKGFSFFAARKMDFAR